MDKLIILINKLLEYKTKYDFGELDLPQIVVVGSQSSGKSSVMERIIGHDILPKDSKLASRCPIILQLINQDCSEEESKEIRGVFSVDNKSYHGAQEIGNQLKNRNNKIKQFQQGITNEPIYLKLFSKSHPTLTLIDLPGIIKNDGDLPPGSKSKIEELSVEYASKPNSIILAISAANVDLANSDSINIAKRFDENGLKTINVITKVDIMDKGTSVKEFLDNPLLRKSLATICVRNRSQENVNNKAELDQTKDEETIFFQKKSTEIPGDHGIEVLINVLQNKLYKEIVKNIPTIESIIFQRIKKLKCELKDITNENLDAVIYDNVSSFVSEYKKLICGDRIDYGLELEGGALISEMLYTYFINEIKAIAVSSFSKGKAMTLLKNTCGHKENSFSIEKTFICLIRLEINQFLEPSLKYNTSVRVMLHKFVDQIIKELEIDKYINFASEIRRNMFSFINEKFTITENVIKNIIRCEKEDIFCIKPNTSIYESLKNKITENTNEVKKRIFDSIIDITIKAAEFVLPGPARLVLQMAQQTGIIDSLKEIIFGLTNNDFGIKTLLDIVQKVTQDQAEIQSVIDCMKQPEFLNILKQITEKSREQMSGEELDKDLDIKAVEEMVKKYFERIRENIIYNVPKWIQTVFIKDLLDEMDKSALYSIRTYPNQKELLSINPEEENTIKMKQEQFQELSEISKELQSLTRSYF